MPFDLQVKINVGDAARQTEAVADGLDEMAAAEGRAQSGAAKLTGGMKELGDALGTTTKESAAAGEAVDKLTGFTGRQLKILEALHAPAKEYAEQVEAIRGLAGAGALSTEEYTRTLIRLSQAFGSAAGTEASVGAALERQAAVLERIRGPMQRYEHDVAALDALMAHGTITALEYEAEFSKLAKQYGTMHGPIAPAQVMSEQPEHPGAATNALVSGLGTGGNLLAGGALGAAVVGLGEHITGLIDRFHEIQDTWTNTTNTALKFTDSLHSANLIIDEQIRLAHDLHSNEAATVELYDTVRDGTDDLNISHQEQIRLTKSLGEEVQLAGKSLEAAGGIVTRLSFAMARGTITTGELARVMKQVPELGDLWTKAFDTDRQGLLAMVRAGQVGVEALMRPLLEEGEQIDKNFERRQRTIKQKHEEWELNEKLYSQKYGVAYGAGNLVNEQVQAFKQMSEEQLKAIANTPGPFSGIAAEAMKQHSEEFHAAMQETIDDVKNLTGFLRPLGDRWREVTGDTAAVRAEVTKINEPIEAARAELEKLNKAFEIGKIDVLDYMKHWTALQTTIGHGVGPQALKITEPIRQAKEELKSFQEEVKAGVDVAGRPLNLTEAQIRKATAGYEATIAGGIMPEGAKYQIGLDDAKARMVSLTEAIKDGQIQGMAARKVYEELITTLNDGRLPEAIKIWNSIHDPIDQASRDFRALEALFRSGRLSAQDYAAQMKIVADTHKNSGAVVLSDAFARLDEAVTRGRLSWGSYDEEVRKVVASFETLRKTSSGIQYRLAPAGGETFKPVPQAVSGTAGVQASLAAMREADAGPREFADQLERAHAIAIESVAPLVQYEQKLKDITVAADAFGLTQEQVTAQQRKARQEYESAAEAFEKIKGPVEQYQLQLKHLDQQLHDQEITQHQYDDALVKAKRTLMSATGEDQTFLGGLQLEWQKVADEADRAGASMAGALSSGLGKANDALIDSIVNADKYNEQQKRLQEQLSAGKITQEQYNEQVREIGVNWSNVADGIIHDLERVALKILEVKAITAVIGLLGGSEGTAATAASAIMHSATGFDGIVQGPGGTDSKLFASWVSPGERVTVTPPGAYPHASAGYASGQGPVVATRAPVNKIYNIYDSSVARAAIDSRTGHQTVLNVLKANQNTVRSYSGTRR